MDHIRVFNSGRIVVRIQARCDGILKFLIFFHKVDVKSLIAINEQYMADAIGRKLHFFEKRRLFVPDNDPHGIRQVFPCTLVDHLLDVDLVLQTAADE